MNTKTFWMILVALGLGTKRHWHILVAICLGVVLGITLPYPTLPTEPDSYGFIHEFFDIVGQLFIRLITMIVVPLVVSSLIVGISSLGDARQLGRLGGKALGYFILFMSLSAVLGLGLAYLLEPGIQLRGLPSISQAHEWNVLSQLKGTPHDLITLFFDMIPKNPIESLANADLVPVIIFT